MRKLHGVPFDRCLTAICIWTILTALSAAPVFSLVTIKDSTTTWHTNIYANNADYGFNAGAFQANTRVAKTFNCKVIDNEYLKVIIVTDFGCRIMSMVYKPTNHEELYTNPCGVPYGMGAGSFYYDWLMVYGGIMPTFSEPEHGKFWLRPWKYQLVKQTADTVTISMSQKDTVNFGGRPGKFGYGATGIECTFTVSMITGKSSIEAGVLLNNPAVQGKNYEYWTMTTLAPGSVKTNPRTTAGAEIIGSFKNVYINGWPAISNKEQSLGNNVYVFNQLRMWKNWAEGIAYAWPDATTPINTFWGVINHDNQEGIIRVCNNDKTIGLKMWSWDYNASVNADVNSNNNTNLPYLELWAGVSKMFFTPDNLGANTQKTWMEYFVPTVKLTNVTHANKDVVCNFTSDKATYSGTADARATITAQLFFTSPAKQVTVDLSFDGTAQQHVAILDSTFTADPLGHAITRSVPLSGLCNGLNKITLNAKNAQGASLINVNIPVTITNDGTCPISGVIAPAAPLHALTFAGSWPKKVFTCDGRFVGEIKSVSELKNAALPVGIYLMVNGRDLPQKIAVSGRR